MKKILFTTALLFLTFLTNAQTLEGEWKFEKIKLAGEMIYFDNSDKDKKNLIESWIKMFTKNLDEKSEKDEMKKNINDNKEMVYASAKEQFAGIIDFKMKYEIYDGNNIGKLYFNELNNDEKMELVMGEIDITDNILKFSDSKRLFDTRRFKISLKANKLVLTDFDEPPMVVYYEKK